MPTPPSPTPHNPSAQSERETSGNRQLLVSVFAFARGVTRAKGVRMRLWGGTGFPLSRVSSGSLRGTCNAVEKIPALAATCNVRTRRKRKLRSRLPPHPQIAELARCNRVVKPNPTELAITPYSFRTLVQHIHLYSLLFNIGCKIK